jgi:hypothetical protein
MPPVNQYCKDNEKKWKTWNDETDSQVRALNKKYGIKNDEYGYTDIEEQLWGDELDEYQESINKINDGKFIGNPSNEFMNRDSSSMTRYANEQHSAITEIMYGTLKDSSDEGAKEILIGKEDEDRMKVLWFKLHPKFPQKTGENWNPFTESFEEDEHPRDTDGQFTSKGGGGLNSRTEQKQNVIEQQIDYLQKSMKPESQTYRAFQKVTDEDRSIRYTNKSLQEDINKLKEELSSSDTTGLPHLPLKQNTHKVETIPKGKNGESLEGFKKGNTTIDVNIPLKREGDDFGYSKEKADRQLNTLRLMWNSLGDEERDIVKSFNIERTPKLIIEDKDGAMVYKNIDDVSTSGYWRPSKNQLNMRVDYDFNDDQLKGTFTHELGHAIWHSIKENNPERIEQWKTDCKKIPPTTKYGKYNKKNWTGMKKLFDKYEKEGWKEFPEEEREGKKANAIKNVAFYEDRYYNELHSEVHMYMMGNNKYKRGTITKGIEKFLQPYKQLHGLS